ncbi:phenoloxidase-activating enzyme-like [Ostrinia nubilalis]|uniref:phenoloxidase-activating enzyme-like n=1 Tax=Ostrinia nubilalis TaxID=29057 RepID=UPI0030823263
MKWTLLIGLLAFVSHLHANEECPAGETCMSIKECPQDITDLARMRPKPIDILERLKKARCGKPADKKLCCKTPPECYTWDGRPGVCELYDKERTKKLNMTPWKIKMSKCTNKRPKDICYSNEPERQNANCESAFPVSLDSGCCGIEKSAGDRIIMGGTATKIDQFPWLALLKYPKPSMSCSGALISSKYVLTAAHCVDNADKDQATDVVLGEYNKSTNYDCDDELCIENATVTAKILQIIIHPEFDQIHKNHDIALIRLEKAVPFTDIIKPICLPSNVSDLTRNPPEKFQLVVAGWGDVDPNHHHSSNVKLHVRLPFVDALTCRRTVRELWTTQICAGGEANKDSCNGDSGGPLMYEREDVVFEVLGITSYGEEKCGTVNAPAIYTKVHSYMNWIHSKIRP